MLTHYNFFGEWLQIPEDTAYLSVDSDGDITAHSDKPWAEPGFWEGYEIEGYIDFHHMDISRAEAEKMCFQGPYLVTDENKIRIVGRMDSPSR